MQPCRIEMRGEAAWCLDCQRYHSGSAYKLSQEISPRGIKTRVRWRAAGPMPDGPGLLQRALNYGKAVVNYVSKGGFQLSLEMANERATLCHACEKYNVEYDRCTHVNCGCTISEKVKWSTERCPLSPPMWDVVPAVAGATPPPPSMS